MSWAVGQGESTRYPSSMNRILIHVEGQTEETFVNEVLSPYLYQYGYQRIDARLMGNARQRSRRGGVRPWASVRQGIINHLRQDSDRAVGVMVDYYGMLSDWPGRIEATNLASAGTAATRIEEALIEDISQILGSSFDPSRFVPYVMMHEFEAILFSDCDVSASSIGLPDLAGALREIRDQFENPEEIDDSPDGAPSKRIKALVPGYEKPLMGNLAVMGIGLTKIREACPHFREWLGRLEALP